MSFIISLGTPHSNPLPVPVSVCTNNQDYYWTVDEWKAYLKIE